MPEIIKPFTAIGPRKESPSISLSELYHENTKLHSATALALGMKPDEKYSAPEMLAMSKAYKQYPSASRVELPKGKLSTKNEVLFDDVISSRRSIRKFFGDELSLDDLSRVLYQSYGVTGQVSLPGGGTQYLRSAPSAGALYPAELYLGVRRVAGMGQGIYHYNVLNHELELLIPGDPTDPLHKLCWYQEYARQASVVILISAVFQRTKRKYGERGYRYVLIDVGHMAQNICLSCTALNLPVLTTCGFFDDEANELLHLDGVDETMLYVAFVG
ncbi:MAG: nitroreductase [Nitrospinaceae bacterium]|nr:MAG: nitroreductase [Nitrospinaceae bacterium]